MMRYLPRIAKVLAAVGIVSPVAAQLITSEESASGVPAAEPALARDWVFTPFINAQVIYSDNIELQPSGQERSDVVIEVVPGFNLRRTSRRLDLALSYSMSNRYYTDSGEDFTTHSALGQATFEIIEEQLFFDLDGSQQQLQANASDNLGNDIVSAPDEFIDVQTLQFGPRWSGPIGKFGDLEASYNYAIVRQEGDATDSDTSTLDLNFNSSRQFRDFEWEIDYFRQSINQQSPDGATTGGDNNSDDSERESLLGQIRYPLSELLALAARAGYEDNNVGEDSDNNNGSFWSLGAIWRPNRFVEATAFYGTRDSEVKLRLAPSARTQFEISRRDRDVGSDTGVIWNGELSHRGRFTEWSASYSEETVNGNQLLLDDPFVTFPDGTGLDGGGAQDPVVGSQDGLDLRTGDFRRERFETELSFRRSRTRLSATGFYEQRIAFGDNGQNETAYGASALLGRALGAHTETALEIDWEYNDDDTQNNEVWTLQAALAHNFSRDFAAGLSYRYARRQSSEDVNDFQENRLGAQLRLQF